MWLPERSIAVGNAACPVPLPANWIFAHTEGVKPLPFKNSCDCERSEAI